MQSASSAAPAKGLKQARPGPATQERSPGISRAKDPQPPTGRDHCPVFAGLFRLAPKVSAALGERSPRQGPVSPPANDDLDRGAQALPPACKTEFRPSRPCPKRCAKFENGRLNFRAPSKFSSRPRCLLSFSTQARTAPFILHPSSFILHPFVLSSRAPCPGLDHTRLTHRHAGRDYRLTDVHGKVVNDVLAWHADAEIAMPWTWRWFSGGALSLITNDLRRGKIFSENCTF